MLGSREGKNLRLEHSCACVGVKGVMRYRVECPVWIDCGSYVDGPNRVKGDVVYHNMVLGGYVAEPPEDLVL